MNWSAKTALLNQEGSKIRSDLSPPLLRLCLFYCFR